MRLSRLLTAALLVVWLASPAPAVDPDPSRGTFEVRCRAGVPFQWRVDGSDSPWQQSPSNIQRLPLYDTGGAGVSYEIWVDAPAGWWHRYRFSAHDVRGLEHYSTGYEFSPARVLDPVRVAAPFVACLFVAALIGGSQYLRARRLRRQLEETHVRLTEAEAKSGLFPLDGSIPGHIDHYDVVSKLGMGGMAVVYRVKREGQEYALKLPLPQILEDPEFRARFVREMKLSTALTHPNLVHVYEVNDGEGDFGYPYMVMELINGVTLKERLRMAPLPLPRLVQVMAQVLDALDGLHGRGIIHRDVKPGNIMVTATGNAKLMDFGIAFDIGTSRLTSTGDVVGTPIYLAPEQIGNRSSTDPRVDVYGVGIVLYETLAGRLPFASGDTVQANLEKLMSDPVPLEDFRPDLPPELARAIMRMIARAPEDRFASAREAADALRAATPPP